MNSLLTKPESCVVCDGVRPKRPLKWLGGKGYVAPIIYKLWMKHVTKYPDARFVEPFAGSAAVTFAINPRNALLNDLNYPLMNLYRWLRNGLHPLTGIPIDEDSFYKVRKIFNKMLKDPQARKSEKAAFLFYYLNRVGFRGLCRFNAKGEFTTPYGHYKEGAVHLHQNFDVFKESMPYWQLSSKDFADVKIQEHDFVYVDSPYFDTFVAYEPTGFSWADHVRVANWCKELADAKHPIVVSNTAVDKIALMYQERGFKLRLLEGPRKISVGKRTPAPELLAGKNV